jgi:ribonucleoside-triphosphate reductase (formate)
VELSEDFSEQKRGGILQSASKRVRMIFSVMASPNRIDILRILNSKGPLTYSELKSLAGFKSKKESGKFAYHLRKLLRQSLVALNKSERRYTITNLGKLVLSLARQIEERSIIESGKMYVRTSHESIEEFNSHKIIQSLVREGSLPLELAQKITEEVENRIYKFQTSYLTSSLIREMVNSVLLEQGHEDYRHKLARFGMPGYDIHEMITNVDGIYNGAEGLLFKTGQTVFGEYLVLNTLPKDVADSHLSGDVHITNAGLWSLLPDTIFVNIKELIEDGIDLRGKFLGVTRTPPPTSLDELASSLSILTSLLIKEASQEVVLDGLVSLLQKYSKNTTEIEEKIANSFAKISTAAKYGKNGTLASFRISLGTEGKLVGSILAAYKKYAKSTPIPSIGLIVDYEKGKINEFSDVLASIIALGGRVMFSKGVVSNKGLSRGDSKNVGATSINLQSLSVNMPRLAFESNKDETYFRARLALLMKPALSAMSLRKKEISDLTRRGLNPILANNTQYMQKGSVTLVVNLIGLKEAIYGILGYENKAGQEILAKVVNTAMEVASKKGKEMSDNVTISITESDAAMRFSALDGEKYGKMSLHQHMEGESYSEGTTIDASEIDGMNPKSERIAESNHLSKLLNGGLLVQLRIPDNMDSTAIKKAIEKAGELLGSFRAFRKVPICSNCGLKEEKINEKCPVCKSAYILG